MGTILIVGAGSGIGYALAESLVQSGNKILAFGRTQGQIVNLPSVQYYQVDIKDSDANFPVIEETIDGIVYCPGTINLKSFRTLKPEDYLEDFQVNALGAVKIIRKYLPAMQASENASIVLFSTVAVQTGMTFHSSIAMAKGAIEGLTTSLAAEFAPKIRVNCIAPSLTNTPLAERLINSEAKLSAAELRHPLKKIGTPHDIAQAAEYLLNARWVTGQILHVDGGMSALR